MNSPPRRTLWMVLTAILSAIIILMSFTPLGICEPPSFEITFIMIPVAVGAILLGPADRRVAWRGVRHSPVFLQGCF
jgi:riboflavin transporter FmnP